MIGKQIQAALINQIKNRLNEGETIGAALIKILKLNKDAVYRRIRLETDLTINDLHKIKKHFGISIDAVLGNMDQVVLFESNQFPDKNFCIDSYLNAIFRQLKILSEQENPQLIITVNNSPFFHLFNFPELLKLKLFFWAKNQLKAPSFQQQKFDDFTFNNKQLNTIYEITKLYSSIPSIELYDPEMLRGFAREIYFYHTSKEIFSYQISIRLFEDLLLLTKHMNHQTEKGFKSVFGKNIVKNKKNQLDVYYNEILNSTALFYYSTTTSEGLFVVQNFLNPLFTNNKKYIADTKNILDNMINSSTKISRSGHKLRSKFFSEINELLMAYKTKILLDAEFEKNNNPLIIQENLPF